MASSQTQEVLSQCRQRLAQPSPVPASARGVVSTRAIGLQDLRSDAEGVAELLLHLGDALGDLFLAWAHHLDGLQRLCAWAGRDALDDREGVRLDRDLGRLLAEQELEV